MSKKVRWGILSTGWIASCFAHALNGVPEAEVVGVASRGIEKANTFGDKYNIPKRYGSYEELAKNPDIDIIYIATPHSHHRDNAVMCLNHGKSLLVEKAFTLNAKEAKEIVELAKSKNLFIMEAMWTRFFPGTKKVKELITSRAIGDVHYISGDLSFNAKIAGRDDPSDRLYNPDLAGGALLDVGIYPLSYASHILGAQPTSFDTQVVKSATGVDERFNIYAKYASGATAFLVGSFQSISSKEVMIVGSHGYIRIPEFYCPRKIIVKIKTQDEEVITFPWPEKYPESYDQNGMIYEAQAVTQYFLEGKKEADLITTNETIQLMETMDAIRARWGLKYPGEK